ncbi:ABC transporter permease [Companilactobacillus sp. RD055328]|uniref:ABC transporter permease n=1 Tax=Companilactobacillus sp. RD055328 TaxID=2916634 RepID=UPI001FC7C2B4|nr:ABC transporter permease [Companilactobacillus sp. RD055328]GKQ43182.1 ABC transporter permease [Companilactobacillus sp. RD055328]
MNFLKRAWQNITFKKGRSLLLIIVMTVIMVFIMAGLLIRNGAVATVENTKNEAGASVTLAADRQKAFSKMRKQASSSGERPSLNMESVSLKTVKKIAKLSQVKSYNVSVSTSVDADSFDSISTSSGSSVMMGGGGPQGESDDDSTTGDITVNGVNDMSTITEFKNNKSTIKSGRALNSDDVGTKNVVIENELAKENDLEVGDTITVKDTTSDTNSYELTIVGIYKASSTSTSQMMGPGQSDPSNTIYTAYDLANTFKGQSGKVDSATYSLNSPTQKSAFIKTAKKDINTNKFSLVADDSTYQQLKKSMKQMESFANKIVWLVAIAGTIILALIIILMVRERRYEMGVLLSLGESRIKIVGQLLVEMLMLLIVSLTLAGATGKFAGQALSKQMMSQITSTTTSSTDQPGRMGGAPTTGPSSNSGEKPSGQPNGQPGQTANNGTNKQNQPEMKLQISAVTLLQLGAFGFTIIAFAVLLASMNILRLEPRKILIG